MQVFLKQNGYEVLQVKPGTLVTLFANNVPYTYSAVTFRIYSYPPYAGPPTVVYEKTVNKNWQNEAWIGNPDEVLLNFAEGSYVLWAGSLEFDYVESATLNFQITSTPDDGGGANWTAIINTITLDGKTYVGKAKRVPFTFSTYPDQLDFVNNWLVNNFLSNLQAQATANNGSKVLKLKLWRDTSPVFRTDYKGELELSTPPGFETPFLVTAIIVVALAAIAYYFIIQPMIGQVIDLIYGPEDDDGNRSSIPWGTIAILAVVAAVILGQSRSKAGVKSNA